jgi:hypothetical protein
MYSELSTFGGSDGFHLHVFQALRETADHESGPGVPGVAGLMHAAVDRLRCEEAAPEMIQLAERISVTLHSLRLALGQADGTADRLRDQLDDLTTEWLMASPIPPLAV